MCLIECQIKNLKGESKRKKRVWVSDLVRKGRLSRGCSKKKKKKKWSYKICRQALYVQDISGVFEQMRLWRPLPVHPAAIMGEDMQATGATLRNLLVSEKHFADREVNVSQYTVLSVSFRILHFTQTRVCTGATDIHSHFIHLIINSFSVRLG